jgi:hypothetical protein
VTSAVDQDSPDFPQQNRVPCRLPEKPPPDGQRPPARAAIFAVGNKGIGAIFKVGAEVAGYRRRGAGVWECFGRRLRTGETLTRARRSGR